MRKYLTLEDDLLEEIEAEQRRLGHSYFSDTVKHMIQYYMFNTHKMRREDSESKMGVFQMFYDQLHQLEDIDNNDYMFRMVNDILYLGVEYEQMVNKMIKQSIIHFESLDEFKNHFKSDMSYQNQIISLMLDKYNSKYHIDLDLLYDTLIESMKNHKKINDILGDKTTLYSFDDFVIIIDKVKVRTIKQEDHYKVDFSSVMHLKEQCQRNVPDKELNDSFRFVYERLSDLFILKDKLNNK